MKISTRLRYGTRFLVDLGAHHKAEPVLLRDIADRQRVSKKYLEQIVTSLKAAGLVRSVRGAKGGYCLTKRPTRISMLEVYRILEGPTAVVDCLEDPDVCPYSLTEACPTMETWAKLGDAIEAVLARLTLADLVRDWEKKKATP